MTDAMQLTLFIYSCGVLASFPRHLEETLDRQPRDGWEIPVVRITWSAFCSALWWWVSIPLVIFKLMSLRTLNRRRKENAL